MMSGDSPSVISVLIEVARRHAWAQGHAMGYGDESEAKVFRDNLDVLLGLSNDFLNAGIVSDRDLRNLLSAVDIARTNAQCRAFDEVRQLKRK
jgi:hypothetical protein